MPKKYTVLGVYNDNGQTYSCLCENAEDAYDAMRMVASGPELSEDLCIIGAIEGDHDLITPGCDNGFSAFIGDLTGEEEDA